MVQSAVLHYGSPIDSFPVSVATKQDLETVSNPSDLPLERFVASIGKTFKYNPITTEWEVSSVSFLHSDAYWERIVLEIKTRTKQVIKLLGSFTPTDSFPVTGSGDSGELLEGNAFNIRGLQPSEVISIDGLEMKNGYILYVAQIDTEGVIFWDVLETEEMFMPESYVYVDAIKGSDTHGTGTQHYPYKTLQIALNEKGMDSSHVVFLLMSSLVEDLTILDNCQNNLIFGSPAVLDSQQRRIVGNHNIAGAGITRIRFLNVILEGAPNVDDYVLTFTGTAGRHYLENTTLIPTSLTGNKAILFTGAESRWHEFYNCYIGGEVKFSSTVSTCSAKFTRQLAGEFIPIMELPCTVHIYGCQRYNQIQHLAGKLYINGLFECWNTVDSDAIISSAPEADANLLEILNANLRDTAHNAKAINKTGTCQFLLDCVTDKSGLHTLKGVRLGTPQLKTKDIPIEAIHWTETDNVFELTIPRSAVTGLEHNFLVVKEAFLSAIDVDGNATTVEGHCQRKADGNIYFNRLIATIGSATIYGY